MCHRIMFTSIMLIATAVAAQVPGQGRHGPMASGLPLGGGTMAGPLAVNVCTQVADDTTPDVGTIPGGCNILLTSSANTGACDITSLGGILPGQCVRVIGQGGTHPTTITNAGDFILEGDWTGVANRVVDVCNVGSLLVPINIQDMRENGPRHFDDHLDVDKGVAYAGSLVQQGSQGENRNRVVSSILHGGKKELFAGVDSGRPATFMRGPSVAVTGTRTSDTVFTRSAGVWIEDILIGQYAFSYVAADWDWGVWLPITDNTTTTLTVDGVLYAACDTVKTAIWHPIGAKVSSGQSAGNPMFASGIFDGEYIWAAPKESANIVRLTPATGEIAEFPHGQATPAFSGSAFDGEHVWFAPWASDNIVKVDGDGTATAYDLNCESCYFSDIVFDGEHLWLIPQIAPKIIKLDPSDGSTEVFPHNLGATHIYLNGVFDGEAVWAIGLVPTYVTKINIDTGALTHYETGLGVGAFSAAIFDGEFIWLNSGATASSYDIIKFDPVNVTFEFYPFPTTGFSNSALGNMAFDGKHIWSFAYDTVTSNSAEILILDPATGDTALYPTGLGDGAINNSIFDGEYVWWIPRKYENFIRTRPPGFGREVLQTAGNLHVAGQSNMYDDLWMHGNDIVLATGGSVTTTSAGDITIAPDTTGNTIIDSGSGYLSVEDMEYHGDGTYACTYTSGVGDSCWEDSIEVLGVSYLKNTYIDNGAGIAFFKTSPWSALSGRILQRNDDGLMIALVGTDGYANNNLLITSHGNYSKSHGNTTPSANPTTKGYSNADVGVVTDRWWSLDHDGTTGEVGNMNIKTGAGGIVMSPASDAVCPDNDGTVDLGDAATEWKDLYVDGTCYCDDYAGGGNVGTTADPVHTTYANTSRIGTDSFTADANYALHVHTSTAGGGIRVESTANNTSGVNITLEHDRQDATPADGNVIGTINYNGEDASNNDTTYGSISTEIQDPTADAEEGIVRLKVIDDSALTEYLRLDATNGIKSTVVPQVLTTQSGRIVGVTSVDDAAYEALATDYIIAYTALSAARTVTFTDALCTDGRTYHVKDEAGASGTWNITLDPEGATPVDGAATAIICGDYNSLTIYCHSNAWFTR